jgi:uncharacterized protein with PQ loop repeat
MGWINFEFFAAVSLICWLASGSFLMLKTSNSTFKTLAPTVFALSGFISLLLFIVLLWLKIERPPMRTLGETRCWYAALLALIGS